MPRVPIGDSSLYVERHGDGYPVLLISGLSGLAAYWEPQIVPFGREFSLVLHDHRGIGKSECPASRNTVEYMATDVVALMDALEIERAHLVGHSTGGAVAQVLALDHPDRVTSLVIAGSWPKGDAYFRRQFALRRDILRKLGPEAYVAHSTLVNYPPAWIVANNESLLGYEAQIVANFSPIDIGASRIDGILAFDRARDLSRIKAPALIIGAHDDRVTPAYFSEILAREIPNAELKLFPEGGHCFTQVAHREFAQAVLPFLQAHTPAI